MEFSGIALTRVLYRFGVLKQFQYCVQSFSCSSEVILVRFGVVWMSSGWGLGLVLDDSWWRLCSLQQTLSLRIAMLARFQKHDQSLVFF